jgi:hypothetical protein
VRAGWLAAGAAPVALTLLLGAGFSAQDDALAATSPTLGVDPAAVPPLARDLLPFLQDTLHNTCPDLDEDRTQRTVTDEDGHSDDVARGSHGGGEEAPAEGSSEPETDV